MVSVDTALNRPVVYNTAKSKAEDAARAGFDLTELTISMIRPVV